VRGENDMNHPVLSKNDFCEIISNIKKQQEKNHKFNEALNDICDGYPVFDSDNGYLASLLLVLNRLFKQVPNDETNTIDWYLCQNTHYMEMKIKGEGVYSVNVDTEELLYELLCAEYYDKESSDLNATTAFFKKFGIKSEV
jgi:hypothetical protein